jgi:periplasmic divalent cation tolerance protein
MNDGIVVLITASSGDEAARIGKALVEEHLAACVNIVSPVRSFFFWEGKTQDAQEVLMLCKSRKHLMEKLIERIKSLHSYSVPEIVALPVVAGSEDYLAWFRENTGG